MFKGEKNNLVRRTGIVETITQRQNLEENILPAFEMRRKNVMELKQGFRAFENGGRSLMELVTSNSDCDLCIYVG